MEMTTTSEEIIIDQKELYCRVCLTNSNLAGKMVDLKFEDQLLNEIFENCTWIELEDDDTCFICHTCMQELIFTYNFIRKCHQSDNSLKKQITSIAEVEIHDIIKSEVDIDDKEFEKEPQQLPSEEKPKSENVCQICSVKVKDALTLRRHQRVHMEVKPYMCDICGKQSTTNWLLQDHMRKHTGETPYVCEFCGKRFRNPTSLKCHVDIHSRNKESFPCETCGKMLGSQMALTKHQVTHLRKFQCDECGKRFSIKTHLTEHKTEHTGVRMFACKDCGKSFRKKGNLTLHERLHGGGISFPCVICSKRFVTRYKLKRHMRQVHSKNKVLG